MRNLALMASVGVLSALIAACSSANDANPGGTSPRGLDPAAVKELEALGYRKYDGKALIADEQPPNAGNPARVSFDPASGPICMDGSPYSVWYADRKSEDLIITLDGGGACWSAFCNTSTSVQTEVDEFAIFMAFPGAPHQNFKSDTSSGDVNFGSWNAVSITYCDGSVFMGDNDFQVASDGTVRHYHGRQNLAAGLDVAIAHFPKPKRVLLAGWSAGGYGSLMATLATRLRFPDAELFVLNDSGVGILSLAESTDMQERLDEWKYGEIIPPSCTQCDGGRDQLAWLFSWTLEHDQDVRIGAASFYRDSTISAFLRMQATDYEQLLRSTMSTLHDAHAERFKRFMLPGTNHVITTYWDHATASGNRFDAWTVAMTNRDDATWKDIEADSPYKCPQSDQASCEATPGCMGVFGKDAASHPDVFVGCAPSGPCGDQVVCSVSPSAPSSAGGCIQFPNACVPEGWEPFSCDPSNPTLVGDTRASCLLAP